MILVFGQHAPHNHLTVSRSHPFPALHTVSTLYLVAALWDELHALRNGTPRRVRYLTNFALLAENGAAVHWWGWLLEAHTPRGDPSVAFRLLRIARHNFFNADAISWAFAKVARTLFRNFVVANTTEKSRGAFSLAVVRPALRSGEGGTVCHVARIYEALHGVRTFVRFRLISRGRLRQDAAR